MAGNYDKAALSEAKAEYQNWQDRAITNKPFNPAPLLKYREGGNVPYVYLDSEGLPTAGIGHLLSPDENKQYKKGDIVPKEIRDSWFEQDSMQAVQSASQQAKELGINNPRFVENLTSVNFQLGGSWNKEHIETWRLMKEGNFSGAAKEAANSEWNKQTPIRVKHFQQALKSIHGTDSGVN